MNFVPGETHNIFQRNIYHVGCNIKDQNPDRSNCPFQNPRATYSERKVVVVLMGLFNFFLMGYYGGIIWGYYRTIKNNIE